MGRENFQDISEKIKKIKQENSCIEPGSLLIEASHDFLVVSLKIEDETYLAVEKETKKTLQEEFFILLEKLYEEAEKLSGNIFREKIPVIFAGLGPGSYTSVRITVTAARSLAQVSSAKIYPLDSLEILAYSFWILNSCASGKVAVVRDAKMGQFYFAGFSLENDVSILEKASVLTEEELLSRINKDGYFTVVTDSELRLELENSEVELINPNAVGLIQICETKAKKEKPQGWETVLPSYLRLSYAEIKKPAK